MARTPDIIIPQKVQVVVKEGFERLRNYRNATAAFLREYVGPYYTKGSGWSGEEPLNLMYHAVRTIVPNLVMENPVNLVTSPYLQYQDYADLLSLGLDSVESKMRMKQMYRAWIVQALFGLGIIKVGLSASDSMLQFSDVRIDPGQVYAKLVSIDNFVMDPTCTDWFESTFFGHRTPVPRAMLLDTDGYDHDLVMRLPVSSTLQSSGGRLADLTQRQSGKSEMMSLQDMVDVVELWVPEADALVTIPDPYQITFEKFIRITDYVGPKEGPYVGLSFSPPVLDNPLPVAPASVWYDLHRIANTIFKKTINQALSQKDVVAYNPAQADEADDLREADDGEFIKSSDPKSIQQVSLGGQNRSNDLFLQEVQILFNYMAQNPDAMAGNMTPGTKGGRETATKASILQNNSTITVEDARGMLYDSAAEVSRRIAWYLHTDPFINVPVIKRSTGGEKQQLTLTPEQRSGNFLDFVFKIKARSMSRLDPQTRTKAILEFSTKVIPSLVVSATAAMSIGVPFNLVKAAVDIGDELGIGEWVAGMFNDPEYQKKIEVMLALGPKNPGKAGGGPNSMAGLMQNGGASQNPVVNTQEQDFNQNAQAGANEGQAGLRGGI